MMKKNSEDCLIIEQKVKMGLIKVKNFNFNKPDELLCILTDETLTPIQKRMFDYFLWATKQKIIKENIIETDNFLKVDVPLDELYSIIGFSKNNNKKIIYIFNRLKKLKKIDILKINLIKNPIDYKNEQVKSIDFINNLKDEDIDEIMFTSLIGAFKISQTQRLVRIYLAPTLVEFLINSHSYTQLNFLVYSFLRSSYSINLYNYLLNKYQSQKALMEKGLIPKNEEIITEKIEVDKLRDILEVPPTHRGRKSFMVFNDKILKPAIKELNSKDVVEFEIKDVIKEKLGRKIHKVAFVLKEKENRKIPLLNKDNNEIIAVNYKTFSNINQDNVFNKETSIFTVKTEKKEEEFMVNPELLKIREKIKNNKLTFFAFVKELQKLQNVEITNSLSDYMGKTLRINKFGMLELDGEELDNAEVNTIRKTLYSNPDLLGKFIVVDEELEFFKRKFVGKVWVFLMDELYYALGVKDIQRVSNEKFKVIGNELLRNIENFSIKVTKYVLENNTPKDKLSIIDKDEYIAHNNEIELKKLEKSLFDENREKFEKWLSELEKESFALNDKLLKLSKESEEYEKLAKKMEAIDNVMMKGYEYLSGEEISTLDKKLVFKKFQEYLKK
jgi:hypothetical protein